MPEQTTPRRLVVGMTGATGAILGIRLLEGLKAAGIETHLVMSEWAERNIRLETEYSVEEVRSLASVYYRNDNQAAAISSGSFPVDGMVVVPCSMNTLAALALGQAHNLVVRAADVMLKERRRLVIVPREMPLNSIHLRNMLTLSDMGVSIVPPMPAFYNHPRSVDDVVWHIVARIMDQLRIDNDLTKRWGVARGGEAGAPEGNAAVSTPGFGRFGPAADGRWRIPKAGAAGLIELPVADLDAANAFYSKAFPEWKILDYAPGVCQVAENGGETLILLERCQDETKLRRPLVYFAVDDVEEAIERVTRAGGVVQSPIRTVHAPSDQAPRSAARFAVGRYAKVCDPDGTVIGLWEIGG